MPSDNAVNTPDSAVSIADEIRTAVAEGREADFSNRGMPEVRAEVIRDLCLGGAALDNQQKDDTCPPECAVRVEGARILGKLDFSNQRITRSLILSNCQMDEIDLSDSVTDCRIRITGGDISNVYADRFHSSSEFAISGTHVTHGVSLISALITGDVRFSKSVLLNPKGSALDGRNMSIVGNLYLDGVTAGEAICLAWAHMNSLVASGATVRSSAGVAIDAQNVHVVDDILMNDGFESFGEVRILNARVGDEVILTSARLFHQAGCALQAERIEARSMYLDRGFSTEGQVRLVGAQLHSQLNCTAALIKRGSSRYALDADSLVCNGDVFLDQGFTAHGEVRLVGAEVKREINLTGAKLNNSGDRALFADGLTTEGSVHLDKEFVAHGEVRFARATVGRQLNFREAKFRDSSKALDISGLVCSGDVVLEKVSAEGTVKCQGARITRDLKCSGLEILATNGEALDVKETRVGGSFQWKNVNKLIGALNLEFTQVRILQDDRESWQNKGDLILQGFQYESLDSQMNVSERLKWLGRASSYSAQPYQQLTWAYQISGQDEYVPMVTDANHVARRAVMKKSRKNWWARARDWARAWDWFLGWSVGYGYKFRRPLLTILILGVVNTGLFYWADYNDIFHPTGTVVVSTQQKSTGKESSEKGKDTGDEELNSTECTSFYPCFIPPVYAFEILVPVLNLRQVNYWLPTADTIPGALLLAWVIINIVLGWILGVAIVGGLSYAFGGDRAAGPRPPPFNL